jgi:hypothetical protein
MKILHSMLAVAAFVFAAAAPRTAAANEWTDWTSTQAGPPSNAVAAGHVIDSGTCYPCSAKHYGGGAWNTHPGKLCQSTGRFSCFIGNGGVEQRYETYKVLTGNPLEFGWVSTTSANALPSNALWGGWVVDSGDCYVCRAWHYGGGAWNLHPGKLCNYGGRYSCFIGNGGVEQRYENYDVMTRLPLPDLWALQSASPSPFPASQPVVFTVSIHNLGEGVANSFTVDMRTTLPAVLDSLSSGTKFTCNAPEGGSTALRVVCTGSLAAYDSTTLKLGVKLTNSFTASGTPLTLYGTLDPANAIPETDENNNLFTTVVKVK